MTRIENMFFSFRYVSMDDKFFNLSSKSTVLAHDAGYALEYMTKTLEICPSEGEKMDISLILGINSDIIGRIGDAYIENDESYVVSISEKDKKIELYSPTRRGLIFAVSTLRQLIEAGKVCDMLIFDSPDKGIRGYRMYTPGEAQIDDFKSLIDTLIYYKYNSVIIEVGGAMEYERHPEINKRWVEFCNEIMERPDKAVEIECRTYPWTKNSIHFENAQGKFISKKLMREIVEYCKEREMEVIPEVPTLSHSDYIVQAHPEIAERENDAYPDHYCTSDPRSYEIVFDIIDEVVEVFEPKYMNIGHDEFYSAAKCDRCKHRDPRDIYIGDIIKLRDYLYTKNITTIMWCDKLYEHLSYPHLDGSIRPFGACADPKGDVPSLLGCKHNMPRDVIMLNWCYGPDTVEETEELMDMGFKFIFGNYSATYNKDYPRARKVADGGFFSNWGYISDEYMQRNLQWKELLNNAQVFWDADYTYDDVSDVYKRTADELYARYKRSLGNNIIEFAHTTPFYKDHLPFWCGNFIVKDEWHMGDYIVKYDDGTTTKLPVYYGMNIHNDSAYTKEDDGTLIIENKSLCNEALGTSLPFMCDGKVYYKTAFANPYPEKKIVSMDYKAIIDADVVRK